MAEVAFTGPQTHRPLGARTLRVGAHGFDVAELELALAWQGFPSGGIDGRFGPELRSALIRFQRAATLRPDGVAGKTTFARLRRPPRSSPIPLGWPLLLHVGDRVGPRSSRRGGPLLPRGGDGWGPRSPRSPAGTARRAPAGTAVTASAAGKVTWAAPRGSWGNLVTLEHGRGVRTMYAHLATIDVKV